MHGIVCRSVDRRALTARHWVVSLQRDMPGRKRPLLAQVAQRRQAGAIMVASCCLIMTAQQEQCQGPRSDADRGSQQTMRPFKSDPTSRPMRFQSGGRHPWTSPAELSAGARHPPGCPPGRTSGRSSSGFRNRAAWRLSAQAALGSRTTRWRDHLAGVLLSSSTTSRCPSIATPNLSLRCVSCAGQVSDRLNSLCRTAVGI